MGDGRRNGLGRGAAPGNSDPSLSRAAQTQRREHCRSGVLIGAEPKRSLQAAATVPAVASDLFSAPMEARSAQHLH